MNSSRNLAIELELNSRAEMLPTQSRSLRVLTFTSLFPNMQQPLHGVFVGQRIQALSTLCDLKVVAPVPWTPATRFFGDRYFGYSQIQREEHNQDLVVKHPRFFVFPRFLKSSDGILMAVSCLPALKRIRQSFPFDIIDAHWAYPDGVSAAILANFFRVPLALTLRGDDINILPDYFGRRQAIRWALRKASLIIALSNELKHRAQRLAGVLSNTVVIPNGIDAEIFHPGDRSEARQKLGLEPNSRLLLSVGRLHTSKGYALLVEAVGQLRTKISDLQLVIVGEADHEADARPAIEATARRLRVAEKTRLVGAQPHSVVADWYRAADLFCLPTSREGSANVLLEALACGLPCITTPVGGNADLISSPDVGMLIPPDSRAFADAIHQGLARTWNRERIARHVRSRTWVSVANECYAQFRQLVSRSASVKP